jgi:hypothetical protein
MNQHAQRVTALHSLSLQFPLIGEFAEHIHELIDRRGHESHDCLKRWVLSSTGMTSRRHKLLCPGELIRQRLSLLRMRFEGFFKSREITVLFLLDMLLQQTPDHFDPGYVLWVCGTEILENFEMLLDLYWEVLVNLIWDECLGSVYLMMFLTIFIGQALSFSSHVLFHGRINNQFLSN